MTCKDRDQNIRTAVLTVYIYNLNDRQDTYTYFDHTQHKLEPFEFIMNSIYQKDNPYHRIKIIRLDPSDVFLTRARSPPPRLPPILQSSQDQHDQVIMQTQLNKLISEVQERTRMPQKREDQSKHNFLEKLLKQREQYSRQIKHMQKEIHKIVDGEKSNQQETKPLKKIRSNNLKRKEGEDSPLQQQYLKFYENLWLDPRMNEAERKMKERSLQIHKQIKQTKLHTNFIGFLKERRLRIPRFINDIIKKDSDFK